MRRREQPHPRLEGGGSAVVRIQPRRGTRPLQSCPDQAVEGLLAPAHVAGEVAVRHVLPEADLARGFVAFQVAARRVEHDEVEIGHLVDIAADAAEAGQPVHRRGHGLPEEAVGVGVDENKHVAGDLAAKLLFVQVEGQRPQRARVHDVVGGVGGQDRDALALPGVAQGVEGQRVRQLRDQRAEGVEGDAAVVEADRLHTRLFVGLHLRRGEHDLLRADDPLAAAEEVLQPAAVRVRDRPGDGGRELVLGHGAHGAVVVAHEEVLVAAPPHALDDFRRVFGQHLLRRKGIFKVPGPANGDTPGVSIVQGIQNVPYDADIAAEAQRVVRIAPVGVIAVDVKAEADVDLRHVTWPRSACGRPPPSESAAPRCAFSTEGRRSAGSGTRAETAPPGS